MQGGALCLTTVSYWPALCCPHQRRKAIEKQFHYLTFFIDEERVYAVLVDKHGNIYIIDPVEIAKDHIRKMAISVAPRTWGDANAWDPSVVIENVSSGMAPLVACLDDLLRRGVVEKDDHICYSPDDSLYNIPLQYLEFRDGILLDYFSLSRVHSAFHLDRVLSDEQVAAPQHFVGFSVPLRQDLDRPNGARMVSDFDAPLLWLQDRLNGTWLRHGDATLQRLRSESLDHCIVHFSSHGWFPEDDGNPFHGSYLVLAPPGGLPDGDAVAGGNLTTALTPRWLLDSKLRFTGSHVSMMACISGLAKEGIAGDALGLDWAFIQAGASSLISTHWKVSAACAARFFTSFYQKWMVEKKSRAAALRETIRELLASDHSPDSLQKWAAFNLTGDFR